MLQRGRTFLAVLAVMLGVSAWGASAPKTKTPALKEQVQQHFDSVRYEVDYGKLTVRKVSVSDRDRRISVELGPTFSYLRFRRELVDSICADLLRDLPEKYSDYRVSISSNGYTIDEQIPLWSLSDSFLKNGYSPSVGVRPAVTAWVRNESRPAVPSKGLEGVHLAVTPSHGLYYDRGDTLWELQRPPLYCSREDLLTQSIAYPFLIPMLENAGAVVVCERERDWQENSVVVSVSDGGLYRETGTWTCAEGGGYSSDDGRIMPDSTAVKTRVAITGNRDSRATAMWVPDIPETGDYAVYVTYRSDSTRVTDARYIVYHSGGSTVFRVNQQIGGGTWLYLGTFHFEEGQGPQAMVSLDNSSGMNGTVSADAVRFGGGTFTETREGVEMTAPAYMFGTKYYGRFAGAPDSVTSYYGNKDDYREDIWSRPLMANWIAGSSAYNDGSEGLGVPVGMYFALHTDAGYRYGDTIHGSLGICTTDFNKGRLSNGESRLRSRDWADMAVSELIRDFKAATGRDWGWRGIWDKNYCESREPAMQSILVELLSHQNFWDMKLALDPNFQFMAARSLYKSILRENVFMYGGQAVVQPLPVNHFRISREDADLLLEWQETVDSLEESAKPSGYVVYQSVDGKGFDNGTFVRTASFRITPKEGRIYRFKVTAWNGGGQSMDSEILAASIVSGTAKTALIVNGFQRLGPPAVIESDLAIGFDIKADAGVQYRRSPILCGEQSVFDRTSQDLDEKIQTGASDRSLEGRIMAGNSFNYPYIHGQSFVKAGWSFISCSRESFMDSQADVRKCQAVDLILGFQKQSVTDAAFRRDYSCFPERMRRAIDSYLTSGGRLLVSGSYPVSDLTDAGSRMFAERQLHCSWAGKPVDEEFTTITGRRTASFDIVRRNDAERLGVSHPDALQLEGKGDRLLSYGKSGLTAGIGVKTPSYRAVVLGFPYECISSARERDHVMRYILNYLIDK